MQRIMLALAMLMSICLVSSAWAAPSPDAGGRAKAEAETLAKQVETLQGVVDKATGDLKTAAQDALDATKAKAAAGTKLADARAAGDPAALKPANDENPEV